MSSASVLYEESIHRLQVVAGRYQMLAELLVVTLVVLIASAWWFSFPPVVIALFILMADALWYVSAASRYTLTIMKNELRACYTGMSAPEGPTTWAEKRIPLNVIQRVSTIDRIRQGGRPIVDSPLDVFLRYAPGIAITTVDRTYYVPTQKPEEVQRILQKAMSRS